VTNGSGSGEYPQGATVSIMANPAPEGKRFREWQVISGEILLDNPTEPSTSFLMPAGPVEISAVYEDIPIPTYTVTVNGSYAPSSGEGSYMQGETVTIDAGTRENYGFSGWTSPDDIDFDDPNSTITTFIMPGNDVTVIANWSYIDEEEDEGDEGDETGDQGYQGGETGKGEPDVTTYNADVKIEDGTETVIPVEVDKTVGTAYADIEPDILTGGADITIPAIPTVESYVVSIPTTNLTTTDSQHKFVLNTEIGSIAVPSNMLTGTSTSDGDKAQITLSRGDKSKLPDEVREAIGDRPLIQLTLSIDGNPVNWSNPDALVTVNIPYTPTEEELANPEGIVVWYIDGSGNTVCVLNGRYNPETGTVTFTTTHFSYYAVNFRLVSFKDVAEDAWYSKAVSFIAARDITFGTGEGYYSPDAEVTRAQFLVMMMRTYGIAPDEKPEENFADAGNTWYTGYLASARRLGISVGIGDNLFAPDKIITRQEMFTMLYNALKVIDQLPEGNLGKTLSDFSDADEIAQWAKDAIKLLVETGMVKGSGDMLLPTDTTTRAQMAQMFYNLISK